MWKFSGYVFCVALACAVCALGAIVRGFDSTLLNYVHADTIVTATGTPLSPNTAEAGSEDIQSPSENDEDFAAREVKPAAKAPTREDSYPARLIIPSIGLDDSVLEVGLNAKGEMDVPDGKTKNVGWYK